jgi:hypothetical protein
MIYPTPGFVGIRRCAVLSYEDALAKKAEGDTSVTIGEAIEMASDSHQEVYPIDRQDFFNWGTGCEKECLTAQLEKYYKDKGCDEPLDAKKIGRDAGAREDNGTY